MIVGIDVGTTSVKVAAFTADGELVRAHAERLAISRPRQGWAEQDPLDWWHGCVRGLEVLAGLRIRSIGVVGQVNTHVFVDEDLRPLAPAILWQDQRCRDIAREQNADPSFAPARAEWFARNQPELWQRTRWMLAPKDFVVAKLTGRVATDHPSVTRLTDFAGRYVPERVGLVEGLADRLPPIHDPTAVLGGATAAVSVGTTDAVGDLVGSATTKAGRAMVSCGTSSVVAGVSTNAGERNGRVLVLPPLWGAHVHAGPTQSAGDALRWWSGVRRTGIDEVLSEAAPGSNGVVFLPHLMGQRAPLWDADVRGSFLGLSSATTGAEMSRAVLEGVAMSARQVLDAVEDSAGREFGSLAFVGGGARSDLWSQVHADVLGRPVRRMSITDAACFGAALLAAIGGGTYSGVETATAAVGVERVFEPDERTSRRLQPLYDVYRSVYRALGDAHRQLASWRAE